MALNKQQLLAKRKTETVSIDGDEVIVSEIGAGEFIDCLEPLKDEEGNCNGMELAYSLICRSVVDENNKRLFEDNEIAEVKRLPKNIIKTLSDAIHKLNGLSSEEKNDSRPTPEDSSVGELQLPLDIDTPTT